MAHRPHRRRRRRADHAVLTVGLSPDPAFPLVAEHIQEWTPPRAGTPRAWQRLSELGTREISIIGGEAFVRKDWLTLVRAIRDHGMDCTMQTGGYKLSHDMIKSAADAGLLGLSMVLNPCMIVCAGSPDPIWKRCVLLTTVGESA